MPISVLVDKKTCPPEPSLGCLHTYREVVFLKELGAASAIVSISDSSSKVSNPSTALQPTTMCRTTTWEDLASFIPYYDVTCVGLLCDIMKHIKERCEAPRTCSLYIEHQIRCKENSKMDTIIGEVARRRDWVREADKAIFEAVHSAALFPPVTAQTNSELQNAMGRSEIFFEGYLKAQADCRALVKEMLIRRAGWEAEEKISASVSLYGDSGGAS
ncbi:hypothetical protein MMC27_003853 [Xylographa pallens]|nr:hypothetical protein [Xylographa pallens]